MIPHIFRARSKRWWAFRPVPTAPLKMKKRKADRDSLRYEEDNNGTDTSRISFDLKVIGITYICEFCANLCRDAGYGSIAGQIELSGKLSVLMLGLPILLTLLETLKSYGG